MCDKLAKSPRPLHRTALYGVLPIASEPPITPESIAARAIQDGQAAHDPLLADPAAQARVTAQEVQAWMDGLPAKQTPTGSPQDLYEIAQTGPNNYLVDGGGTQIWADGVRPVDARLLEAKYIDNPDRSPYIDGSNCPDFIRIRARAQVDSEFQRYAAALKDPNNPVNDLEVIVSDERAVPYFDSLLQKYGIRGQVVVRPWSPGDR